MLNNKKILLVHPLGYRSDAAGHDISRLANIMPPLGLASIAAYVERRGMSADIIDCYARPDSDRAICDYLKAERPAFLGLSCTTSSFLDGIRIAEMARSIVPGITTVFGGPHVSALKEELFPRFRGMDIAVIGEGEETMAQLMEKGLDDPASVKGIIYRPGGGAEGCFTGYPDQLLELDDLPFPAYEKLEGFPTSYMLPIFNYPKTPNTSCISSRGCPYSCSYCDRSVFRRSFRYNSASYLYEHLRYLRERFGVRHINFYDDQFTFNRKRVEEFARLMIDRPLGMTYNCAVRAEHIDPELLALMKRSGCWMMSLGIETGDPELLAQHRQNADLDHLARKIRMIKDAGMRTKGLLMIGLPGETEESIRRSMDYVFSLPIDDFNLAKFTPFPGSPIYDRIHELGEFNEDWEQMDCMNFLFVTKGMTRERLEELFQEFYRNHFKRPKVLWGYVAMLWRSPHSWQRFIGNMGSFLKFTRNTERYLEPEG
ncbi:B12-binding domain-containing radical SAM protein [Geomonas sp. RF6]|uniref:B12-binding domain-containing radical SAM protein n=1 Tax=Geomonas sp. RF6 TaxID=2897342 RepID=UPI001E544AE4|nr:radical SAM protein [Geomonas sp. RF6]UFS69371.1 B12-binding domain-containing radical SAM protein [Geomonas sp. RF6]